MGFNIKRTNPDAGQWTSPVRLYQLEDGSVVEEEGVTDRASLLVGVGGQLPLAQAESLGLVAQYAAPAPAATPDPTADPAPAEDEPEPGTKAQTAPPRTKAQAGPQGTK